jgi:hypothetical protein
MTPKDKANQLIRLMTVDMKIDFWQTKQCAINAVDEILKLAIWTDGKIYDYFEEVKKELENKQYV